MNYQNLPNKDSEILSLEDEKLRKLIGTLKRIDAPKDFDFRLRGRIAKAKPSDFRPRFLPALRYVLPLSAILVIFAFVVLNGLYFPDSQAVSQVEETVQPIKVEQKSPAIAPFEQVTVSNTVKDEKSVVEVLPIKQEPAKVEKDVKPSVNETQFVSVKSPTVIPKKNLAVKEVKDDNGGGSRDSASSSPINILPNGVNLNSTPQTPSNSENLPSLNAQEILSQFGIEASFTDASWKVKSFKKYSLAESSGVQIGDVVEAIDGEKLSDKPLRSKSIAGKKLTILRGAEKIEISLQINK